MSKSQSSHSIFKLTRKVTKFANDLALGSTSMYGDEVEDKKFLEFKQKKQREREEKREKEVEHLRKEASEKGIEAYLDHFRFFLKHMDDSDINDPINYALSRRDLWLSWYKRFLTGLRAEIADYENLIKEKERLDRQSIHSASSYKHIKSEADYKLRTKLHDLSSIAPPPIDYVNSSMFQDKRIILILLWYLQILKKLLDQPTLISREILEKLGNSKETVDPSIKPQLQEVTVVTCNKMIGELDTESQSNESIYTEGSIYSANVEFINGWQVRHDNRDLHTNFVSITKKYHRMIDISGKGYLPPELLAENPSFTTPLLDSEFFRFKLNDQQREFLKSYSSFTTPSMDKIPLRSNSQSCVTCADFTLTATEDNLESSLAEFHRIIKPNGFLQLYLWDIDQVHAKSLNHQATDPNEYVRQEIWQRMAKLSKDKNRIIPDITNRIISSLKQQGFKKVKISHVGYPQITTLSEPVESHSQSHSASFSESDPYSTSYQDRINSVLTTNSNKGYKDLRMNSFFEFFSNYMEFLLFTKVLSVFKFTNSMKFKEGTTTQTEVVDPEEVNLIKLFIDYKLHGCSGKLVQNQILSSAKVKFTTASTDGVKYEGLCYSMVVVAEK
ncbi:hypothetical protein CANARDRAFT_222671 [[Candida] arabinofermentans NRRL YB-2248]|uniref:Uncharacterized protein n=1 Tax=[Candida] arabinofermentans NRRL YB-2248 TaxID=983967 RepID=A0A1E4T029_9ASCO|nr:hypothetical protein CANARDRAFT_222671 [[Candida] arabinofermentans NRRL YB-2248]